MPLELSVMTVVENVTVSCQSQYRNKFMTYYPDLATLDYFNLNDNSILRAVGWLGEESELIAGQVSSQFFNRLCELADNSWQPTFFRGLHDCELCQIQRGEEPARGVANLFIPFGGVIYVAPELILHYISEHQYVPPDVFVEAVVQCPDMRTKDYKELILKNGGAELIDMWLSGSARYGISFGEWDK